MPSTVSVGDKKPTVLGTSATLLYQPTGARDSLTLINEGRDVAYIGQSGVTTSTGLPLWPGDRITLNRVPQAVYGIGASTGAPFISVVPSVF